MRCREGVRETMHGCGIGWKVANGCCTGTCTAAGTVRGDAPPGGGAPEGTDADAAEDGTVIAVAAAGVASPTAPQEAWHQWDGHGREVRRRLGNRSIAAAGMCHAEAEAAWWYSRLAGARLARRRWRRVRMRPCSAAVEPRVARPAARERHTIAEVVVAAAAALCRGRRSPSGRSGRCPKWRRAQLHKRLL